MRIAFYLLACGFAVPSLAAAYDPATVTAAPAAVAADPAVVEQLRQLAANQRNADAFDYFALRQQVGDAAFRQLVREGDNIIRARHGGEELHRLTSCLTAPEKGIQIGLSTALKTDSAAAWLADRTAAGEAHLRYRQLQREFFAGRPSDLAPFEPVRRYLALSAGATDPLVRELFRRVAVDQFTRAALHPVAMDSYAPGLSSMAKQRLRIDIGEDTCAIDLANRQWLRTALRSIGWFSIQQYGEAADVAAWLMVQHSDRDPSFQQEVLARLEPLVSSGATKPSNYALLFDRVAIGAQRPQRYGSQGRCVANGTWEPFSLEDTTNVDARRQSVGLPPLAEYAAGFAKMGICRRG